MTPYIIRGGVEGKARLGVLSRTLRATTTEWLIARPLGRDVLP